MLEGGLSQRVTFLTDDSNLEGISVFRIEFQTVREADSIELQLTVLGCAEGKNIFIFSQYRHVFKIKFHAYQIQKLAPFCRLPMPFLNSTTDDMLSISHVFYGKTHFLLEYSTTEMTTKVTTVTTPTTSITEETTRSSTTTSERSTTPGMRIE